LGLSEKIEWLATESKETRKLLQELESFSSSKKFCLDLLNAQLRPYQETGLQWLWFLYCHELSGLLCDEMGLGKTHQAMALMACANYEDERKTNKYLVVCPTSVIYHWQESLEKFLPDVKVCVFHGYPRDLSEFDEKYQVLLTSYGILRLEKDKISEFDFEIAIYDEIQIAKNYISKTHKALKLVPAKMRLGLTGTPIENYLQELKALFDVILPNYLPSVQMFREFFTVPIEKKFDEGRKRLLSSLIKPFILRRKKSEVLLDLPEKIEEIAHCDLSLEQKQLYNETLNLTKRKVMDQLKEKNKPIPYAHVFAIMGKLKQICDHPSLIYKDIDNFQSHESGKWDLFVELLNEARESSQKVVIFSQYLNMLAIIEKYLKKKSIGYAVIKGSTKNRAEEIRRFHQDPKCEVFVASLLAAGLGINLSAGSVVIHYDRWWNAAKEDQATDRVHRIGQSRGVQVFKLVTKNTLEERIHQLIQRKRSLVEDTIGVDDSESIKRLTREEIIAALQEIPIE
jgi:SNF2 family DNA or RNA helicase